MIPLGLTNRFVEKVGKKILGTKFKGVYPADSHPNMKFNKYIIFNQSNHDEIGTHFVCFGIVKNRLIYFDSLGFKLNNNKLIKFRKTKLRKNLKFVDMRVKIQSKVSNFCGIFCLAFLLSLKRKDNKFFNQFDFNNLKNNDEIALNYILQNVC